MISDMKGQGDGINNKMLVDDMQKEVRIKIETESLWLPVTDDLWWQKTDRIISRGVLHAAVVRRALVIFIHEDRRLIGGEEGGRSVQVLVKVVLPFTGCLVYEQIQLK